MSKRSMDKSGAVKVTRMTPAQMDAMRAEAEANVQRFGWDRQNPRCGSNKKVTQ